MTKTSLTLACAALSGLAILTVATTFDGRPRPEAAPGDLVTLLRAAVEAADAPVPIRHAAAEPVLAPASLAEAPLAARPGQRAADLELAPQDAPAIARVALAAMADPALPPIVAPAAVAATTLPGARSGDAAPEASLLALAEDAHRTDFALSEALAWSIDAGWVAASGAGPVILEVRPLPRDN